MGTPMSNEELTLFQLGELTWRQDGLSPMEYLNAFMYAHQDTFRELHIIQRVRHPSGVLAVPTPNPKIIDRLTDMYINKVRGKSGLAIMSIPETSKFIPFGDMNVSASGSFSLIDYIIRGVAAAFGVSTTSIGWTQTTLERSAAEQGDNQDAAKLHILRLWQHYYNTEIIPYLDPTGNLMLMFTELPVEDEADTVESLRVQAGTTQWKSDNDIRISSGLDPIDIPGESPLWPWYNDVKIVVGGTPIPQSVAAGLPQFQTVPGYDWKTGEIDPQIAVQQIAALQPPPPAPDQAQGDGQDGNQANGNGNGNGTGGDMSNLAPVPAGKAYTSAEEEHLADLDKFFTEHFRKAKDGGE